MQRIQKEPNAWHPNGPRTMNLAKKIKRKRRRKFERTFGGKPRWPNAKYPKGPGGGGPRKK